MLGGGGELEVRPAPPRLAPSTAGSTESSKHPPHGTPHFSAPRAFSRAAGGQHAFGFSQPHLGPSSTFLLEKQSLLELGRESGSEWLSCSHLK